MKVRMGERVLQGSCWALDLELVAETEPAGATR